MLLSFKTQLILNNKQVTAFTKASRVARHAYNWANAIIQKCWDEKQKVPSAIDLHKRLVAEVKAANQWCYETNKNVPQ
ncbi:MAG: helix-turn-helix domain-containing protein [Nostoc sp.]|uniref:helix-turn-helix domain-containing protein n=1 Tax=Nostoc sp. TaxID=1180 RepID=UPI002FF45A0D